MNKAQELHDLGQSLWLDNITREILDNGTLRRYMDEFSVTGLTSNPTIFDEAIGNSAAYDDGIRDKAKAGKSSEALFMELALEDLRRQEILAVAGRKAEGRRGDRLDAGVAPGLILRGGKPEVGEAGVVGGDGGDGVGEAIARAAGDDRIAAAAR